MADRKEQIAFNQSAPDDERNDANQQLYQEFMPGTSDLIHTDEMKTVISEVQGMYQELDMRKSLQNRVVVPFPSKHAGKKGVQSVTLDERNILIQSGDFYERQGMLDFNSLRQIVAQCPLLNSIIGIRDRQVQRFSRICEQDESLPGFAIRHRDRDHLLTDSEKKSFNELGRFFSNSGFEFLARKRQMLKRDSFSTFMSKITRDSLIMDSVGIELEWKKNRSAGIDGFYAVDGGSIRLCSENGYEGDEEIFAVQVIDGMVHTAYSYWDLVYVPRNPRSDVTVGGYGLSEVELLVRVVTGFLNAMSYNAAGFDKNSIPKGLLSLVGAYSKEDLAAFKHYWASTVRGVENSFGMPVLVSKDAESKATFTPIQSQFDDMAFTKYVTFLTSLGCSLYGLSSHELGIDAFTAGASSSLKGSDTEEKLQYSEDSGLRPLLGYFENLLTDYIVAEMNPDWVFRWTGLDQEDATRKFEKQKLILTVDEMRAQEGYQSHPDPLLGSAPLSPTLLGVYMNGVMTPQGGEDDDSSDR